MSSLILIDAGSYVHRAYHTAAALVRPSDEMPTGCILQLCEMMWKLTHDVYPTGPEASHMAFVCDASRRTWRHDVYPAYKANRKPTPADLAVQLPYVRRVAEAFGLATVAADGYEADDLIASYAAEAAQSGLVTEIVSVDKDMMQLLVDDMVHIWHPVRQRQVERADVIDKLGVGPELAIDAQALIGDTSDNVPGVAGIGPKTAGAMLRDFGSIEAILANPAGIAATATRYKMLLPENHARARLSKELVTLRRDAPLPLPISDLAWRGVDYGRLLAFASEMEFLAFGARVSAAANGVAA